MNNSPDKDNRKWLDYSSVGLMFPASIIVGFGLGYLLDSLFHTAPILMIVFLFYGIAAAFYNLFKVTRSDDFRKK